ncbi:uncharacterized protein LOC130805444 [Amaranthus tricolor]|uniref:uncharacterized protein LOC130805444 n=1 Tax=Amaranthus tricolor TaxID=29722 RepID=UPI002587C9E9|nr:uncharacterized protein LOC130805444 [Amaranthus tricolor]
MEEQVRNNVTSSDHEARVRELEAQLARMERTNERLLTLMENQAQEAKDDGKYFKNMTFHLPPQYDGEADPVRFENWLAEMEKLLEVINCPAHLKLKLAFFYLSGPGELWWHSVKAMMTDTFWDDFLITLRQQFYPSSLQRKKENEFLLLRQGLMTVIEYSCKFNELSRFASDIVSKESVCASRFFEALNLKIQKGIRKYSNFRDLYDRALEYERILDKEDNTNKTKYGGGNNNRNKWPTNWDRKPFYPTTLTKTTIRKCRLCGKDHQGRLCIGKIICFKCKKEGHVSTNCREGIHLGARSTGIYGAPGSSGIQSIATRRIAGLHAISKHVDDLHQAFEGKVISGHFAVGDSLAHILFDSGVD